MRPDRERHPTTTLLERAVRGHPGVTDAVAELVDEQGSSLTFVYLSTHDDLTSRRIRSWLHVEHPGRPVPDEIHVVPEIPRHGDCPDWSALRRVRDDAARLRAPYVAADTDTERYLVELWEDMLELDRVGAGDDFFSLGGHSMLAVRIRRAIQRDRGVVVPAELLFINSVLADQARAVDEVGSPAGAEPISS